MATFIQRALKKWEAEPNHPDFAQWPITRLTGVEIELTGNARDNDSDSDDDGCRCGDGCPEGSDCTDEGCNYCHADHSDDYGSYGERSGTSPVDRACSECVASIVSDGSLGDSGIEIVTPAMAGHHMPRIVRRLTEAISFEGLSATHSCGLHVHADARDLSWYDMRRIMLAYVIAEPFLRLTVPPRRRGTHYSLDCGEFYRNLLVLGQSTKETKRRMIDGLYGIRFAHDLPHKRTRYGDPITAHDLKADGARWERQKREKYHDARYKALNVHSWIHRGTLEWRLPPGTRRAETILGYARTFQDLIHYAIKTSERDLWGQLRSFGSFPTQTSASARARSILAGVWTSPWTQNRFEFFASREGARE